MTYCTPGPGFPDANTAKLLSKNNSLIWAEIAAIQQAILSATSGCQLDTTSMLCVDKGGSYCVTVAGTTPMTYIAGISAIDITAAGSDYFPIIATVEFTHLTGTGATASATVENGVITDITVTDGGTGYTVDPVEVVVNHPTGQGFSGTVITDGAGVITAVTIQDGGILYSDLLPTVVITDMDGNGSGAVAELGVGQLLGDITDVTIISSGANYSATVIGEIFPALTSTGTSATVSVTSIGNPYVTVPYDYYLTLLGQSNDCALQDQLDTVSAYFLRLGYTVDIQVNPNTGSTIQWKICWC